MTILESTELFNQDNWRITREIADLPDGRTKEALIAHRCDSVHLLAFKNENEILMLREYRPFFSDYIWMVPSGKVDKETDILVAAGRELREETGFNAKKLHHYFTTEYSDTLHISNHVFIAKDLYPDALPQDASELIEVHTVSLQQAIKNVQESSHVHGASLCALLRYKLEH